MFSRVATLSTLFFILPAFSAAAAVARQAGGSCNVGTVSCCNSVQSSDNAQIATILSQLGIAVGPTPSQVGLNCSPIGNGTSINSCNAQPVCCENDQFNGIVNIGCSPVIINL